MQPHSQSPTTAEPPLMAVRGLRTWFDTDRGLFRAVDGISFDVGRARSVGLVGESGCGKSVTSLSLMWLVIVWLLCAMCGCRQPSPNG